MQFIYLDETEQGFKISTEAEEFLRSLDPTIELGICCVVGKYRTGKSYIINKGKIFIILISINYCYFDRNHIELECVPSRQHCQ